MPLNQQQMQDFKNRLEDLRRQLTKSLHNTTEGVKSPDDATGYKQHQADQGTDDFDRTITIELTNRELHILKQIDRALEKIEDNSYGICDISGLEIPIKRLEAVPYATMTVAAQEKLEKGLL
ncbi:MAG: dksA [Chlamydiales bacterium]|jgi:DnaK suppressor protein|nr:dksA [Chlamydiales bacterium]